MPWLALLLIVLPTFAHASYLDDAVNAYRGGAVIYQSTTAQMRMADPSPIEEQIRASRVPVYVAILPSDAQLELSVDVWPLRLAESLPVPVAVGVVVGQSFRVSARQAVMHLDPALIEGIASTAFNAKQHEGLSAVLSEWVSRMSDIQREITAPVNVPAPLAAVDQAAPFEPMPTWVWVLSAGVLFGSLLVYGFWRRHTKRRETYRRRFGGCGGGEGTRRKSSLDTILSKPQTKKFGRKTYAYSPTRTANCRHYTEGGYVDGQLVTPGYYDYAFWSGMSSPSRDTEGPSSSLIESSYTPAPSSGFLSFGHSSSHGGGTQSGGGVFGGGHSSGGGDWGGGDGDGGDGGGGGGD